MSPYPVTWITESLAVGYAPMSHDDLQSIKGAGIDALVNLCAEFSDLHLIEEAAGFEVFYLPIWDEDIPGMEALEEALAWLDEAVYLGKRVLVHCRYGIGRTGTFVTSYLIRRGFGLKAASRKLRPSRANPSSYGQWKLLKRYGKKSGVLKLREPSLEIRNSVDLGPFFSDYESLIQAIDREVAGHLGDDRARCGRKGHACCKEPFELQLIETIHLHSKMNKQLTANLREALIEKAVAGSGKETPLCPLNDGTGCQAYALRPTRCRIYEEKNFSTDKLEIKNILFELSQSLFLAFSGCFLPDAEFTFSVKDTVSGKFVQKYFDYMARMENR